MMEDQGLPFPGKYSEKKIYGTVFKFLIIH
jgi:hypothetical protein